MSVELAPSSQLGFHRPLTQLVKRTLSVANTNSQPVAFKVKTTAPKQYCVRPNSGRIEPGERVEVQVLLQPMKEEPAAGTKCRDKFLVQSAIITPDRETRTLQELWSTIEAEAKAGHDGLIHEQKIRCAFLPPIEDGENGGAATSGTTASSFATPSNFTNGSGSGSGSRYETVKGGSGLNEGNDTFDRSISGGAESPHAVDAKENQGDVTAPLDSLPRSTEEVKAAASQAATAVGSAAAGAAAAVGLAGKDNSSASRSVGGESGSSTSDVAGLQRELASARAEIAKLKELVQQKEKEASSGLRQRNVGGPGDSKPASGSIAGVQTATATQEGIPLPMVAAIAGGVFFFTWLFL